MVNAREEHLNKLRGTSWLERTTPGDRDVFKKLEEKGYIKQVLGPCLRSRGVWYAPHFPVLGVWRDTSKIRPVFDWTEKPQEIDKAVRLCWSLELYFMPELPHEAFGVWRPWKIGVQQLDGYGFGGTHRPTALFREVACGDTSGFLLAVVAFLASRPRRSEFTAGNRADFKGGELALKNTAKKGQINIKFGVAPVRAPRWFPLLGDRPRSILGEIDVRGAETNRHGENKINECEK
jgi:hypothetical protein